MACVLVGTLPVVTIGPYLNTAMRGILGTSVPAYSLAVWHGFTTPLLMSALALAGGIALYALLYWRWDHALRPAPFAQLADGKRNFEVLIVRLIRTANRTMHLLYSPRLQTQLAVLAVTVVAIAAMALGELTFAKSPQRIADSSSLCAAGNGRLGLRHRSGAAGQVSPVGRAHHGRRDRAPHLPDLCMVLRARPGAHPDQC